MDLDTVPVIEDDIDVLASGNNKMMYRECKEKNADDISNSVDIADGVNIVEEKPKGMFLKDFGPPINRISLKNKSVPKLIKSMTNNVSKHKPDNGELDNSHNVINANTIEIDYQSE